MRRLPFLLHDAPWSGRCRRLLDERTVVLGSYDDAEIRGRARNGVQHTLVGARDNDVLVNEAVAVPPLCEGALSRAFRAGVLIGRTDGQAVGSGEAPYG